MSTVLHSNVKVCKSKFWISFWWPFQLRHSNEISRYRYYNTQSLSLNQKGGQAHDDVILVLSWLQFCCQTVSFFFLLYFPSSFFTSENPSTSNPFFPSLCNLLFFCFYFPSITQTLTHPRRHSFNSLPDDQVILQTFSLLPPFLYKFSLPHDLVTTQALLGWSHCHETHMCFSSHANRVTKPFPSKKYCRPNYSNTTTVHRRLPPP